MPALIRKHRKKLLFLLTLLVVVSAWIYWNRPTKDNMAAFVPADSVAFIEANDLVSIAHGIEQTEAWRKLAGPMGSPSNLLPHRWLIWFARWTGIGSIDAVLAGRSQAALVFTQAQATESGNTLTIKPLAALIIQTHTSPRRMRPTLEQHIERLARRAYGEPVLTRKQVGAVELAEWSSADKTRRIVFAFVDTVVIVGNDDSVVLQCVDVRGGKRPSISSNAKLEQVRRQVASSAPLFGFISKAGVKPIIQAWALSRAGDSSDAATVAQLISNTFGNLIDAVAWSSTFDSSGTEDRFFVAMAEGVAERLRHSMSPEPHAASNPFSLVPPDARSVTLFRFRDTEEFWQHLNEVVSSRADVVAAIVARPVLRGLLKPYGIEDPDLFFRAVGTELQTIRLENEPKAVLVAEAFDRPALRKLALQRIGEKSQPEKIGEAELLLSKTENWSAAFDGNYFLMGPADAVRRCLTVKAQAQSVTTVDSFRRARTTVDVSLPLTALTFTKDRETAISFVELFTRQERSVFSANASAIQEATESLPYSVSVTMLKDDGILWTSKSSFGLLGSLFTTFAPENSR